MRKEPLEILVRSLSTDIRAYIQEGRLDRRQAAEDRRQIMEFHREAVEDRRRFDVHSRQLAEALRQAAAERRIWQERWTRESRASQRMFRVVAGIGVKILKNQDYHSEILREILRTLKVNGNGRNGNGHKPRRHR